MNTLAQTLQQKIKILEESGSEGALLNILKKQLKDIQKQKEPTEEKWSVQAIKNKD